MDTLKNYQSTPSTFWQGRTTKDKNEYIYQTVACQNLVQIVSAPDPHGVAILGFECDSGIKRNHGRVGATLGPQVLRETLGKLSSQAHSKSYIHDFGNITCQDEQLEMAQTALAQAVHLLHEHAYLPILFGGGHEIAWGHYQGLSLAGKTNRLGIINFDAHFDLRPIPGDGIGTSGTPFKQIAQHCQQNSVPFSYFCLGIQNASNTPSLFATAKQLNVEYVLADAIHLHCDKDYYVKLDNFINAHEAIYLSICLDVFASAYAPGVSAPQSLGIYPWQAIPILRHIMQSGKVISIDIAELSPPHDQNDVTAMLAAHLVRELIILLSS